MQRLSAIAHSAYLDLRTALEDEQASDIIGTPRLEKRGAKSYWYDMYRVGSDVRKRYIGEDTPEMAERIARHQDLKAARKARAADRTRLIRVLRAEGVRTVDPATGSLLSALEQTGAFRLGGTIVGTNAFRLYECELGIRIQGTEIMQTGDLDIAQFERLSLALGDTVETPLNETFKTLDFAPIPSINHRSIWRWRQTKSNTLVEFLTPSFRPEEDTRDLPALGVAAQSLHFLNYLIAEPIKAAAIYRAGVLVQIPRPEAYAIHKLIVADRRQGPDRLKARKDMAQAALLIEALAEDRPDELREAYEDALDRGPQWRAHIGATLKRMPETAARLAAL
ncbi:MAG: GSU2403 family nucleotidyltransferase fold protein [Tabrizicola flagellatus]|uniref:nucleotidyltransferase family protein n=1 Tax=Tabrizicola flagellatus TaxID=2593021 RepID=UPI00391C7FE0